MYQSTQLYTKSAKTSIIVWTQIDSQTLSMFMMWQKQHALKLLNFWEIDSNDFSWLTYVHGGLLWLICYALEYSGSFCEGKIKRHSVFMVA